MENINPIPYFTLLDYHQETLYYDITNETIARSSGLFPSENILPIYYDRKCLFIIKNENYFPLTQFKVIPIDSHKVVLHHNGYFGAAEPHTWELIFNRSEIAGWEIFECVEYTKNKFSASLLEHAWLSKFNWQLHSSDKIHKTPNGFYISDKYYDFIENQHNLKKLYTDTTNLTLSRGLMVDSYIKYNPLIYFVVFGDEEQKELARESIRSLINIGNYTGDICIITDRRDMHSIIPDTFPGQLHIIHDHASTRIEMWRARYHITKFPLFEQYQPILYLDTDIVCNDTIFPVLEGILTSSKVCAGTENHPGVIIIPSRYTEAESVGRSFFAQEGQYPNIEYGFNSGIIGIPNLAVARTAFEMVVRIITRMIVTGQTDGWVDQAVLNYVTYKLDCIDEAFLSPHVAVGTGDNVYPYVTASKRPTLIHFWSTHKHERLPRIQSYITSTIQERAEQ
ncbi:glycosyltransferase [Swingsia samuiensis]|uniref:Uncharacterized protein n=1 Tax=Swingsia samuiensis TaxID=1293412 RepID=A0A4Y6UJX9_9PROT|nr:glycosyltransferase [Swingsia samuiensis]QDH16677.1 hypothetical protein E3D00_03115 [Swingsia samuiensis]